MNITLVEVRQLFGKLVKGEISREVADRWAYDRIKSFEVGNLVFDPATDEEKIWSILTYLHGIDIQEEQGGIYMTTMMLGKIFYRNSPNNTHMFIIHHRLFVPGEK